MHDEIVSLLREMRDDVTARIRELAATGLLADWADPEGYDLGRVLSQVVQVLLAARRVRPDDEG